jgi:radical SAM superfamily enzyme YgiQ (UPF0313 family)
LGIAYREQNQVKINALQPLVRDLDDLPLPTRELLDIKKYPGYHYKKSFWDTSFISGRGCPFQCLFCSNPVWKHQRPWIRLRSPSNIADEIEFLKGCYAVDEFFDQTDLFNADIQWAKMVCDELIKRNLKIFWKVQVTAQNIDEELAEKMKQAGCWLVLVGIETGNDPVARGVNKKTDRASVKKSLEIFKKHGLKTLALLMAFNVWEKNGQLGYEDRRASGNTLKFARELIRENKIDLMTWSLTTPYPGSQLFSIAQKHRLIPENLAGRWEYWDSSENLVMKLPGVSERDWRWLKIRSKIWQMWLLLKSSTFNWQSSSFYCKRLINLIKN